jgi:NitT/TauT family transport system substrate-binding protein
MSFPIVGYAVTRAWEQKYPRTKAAFVRALEKGQAVADSDRRAVERAAEAFLGMPPQTAAIIAVPSFPSAWTASGCSALPTPCAGSASSNSGSTSRR